MDLLRAIETAPETLDYIYPGLRRGRVGGLSAPGGTGKSYLLLTMAAAAATGQSLIPKIPTGKAGPYKVVYITAEEDQHDIHQRIRAIADAYPCVGGNAELLDSNLHVYPAVGESMSIINNPGIDSPGRAVIDKILSTHKPDVLILDPLAQMHGLDENNNSDMTQLMRILSGIAQAHNLVLIVSHHSSKATVLGGTNDTQQSTRGASSIIDNARWGTVLYHDKKAPQNEIMVKFVKLNNCAPISDITLIRTRNGALVSGGTGGAEKYA